MNHKVGFFGGCFNPVTNAHLRLIQETIEKENLEKVYFVPMGNFYEKKDLISLEHRIKMLELVLEKEEKMEILNISNTNQKMYAIDTFQIIEQKFPNVQRFFIMGSDNFQNIKSWKEASKLTNQYQYIVLDREKEINRRMSASLVREKIKRNETVDHLIPYQVLAYIEQKKLYK